MNKKQDIRYNEFGEEILYEIRHNLSWWDYVMFSIFFPFSCLVVYAGLELTLVEKNMGYLILVLVSLMVCILLLHDIFYKRKNRFCITNQGIGFECRHWFRMKKGFFKFGEVDIVQGSGSRKIFYAQPIAFTLFPLQTQVLSKWYGYVIKSKTKYEVVVLMVKPSILSPKIYDTITEQGFLKDFIMQKTKESLKNQNIKIELFEHIGRFAIFGTKNEQ